MKRQTELAADDSSITHSPAGPTRGGFLPTAMLAIAGVSGSVTACFEQGQQDDPAAVEVQRKSLDAQFSVVEGIGETLAESFLRTSDGAELAFLVRNRPDLLDPIRGLNTGILEFSIRDEDGNFAPLPVEGTENLAVPFGQKITAYEGPNGVLELFIENFGHIYRYQGTIVEGVFRIQPHPNGNEVLDPDNPENLLGATYSQAIPEGVVVVHANKVYLFSNRGNDPEFLGELTNEEERRYTEIGDLPDLSSSGYTIFLDDSADPRNGLREVRVNLSQGTILERLKAGLGSGDVDSEPVRVDGRNKEAIWVQVGDGNEVYIGRSNGIVERLSLELDPIVIPPVDAAVQDAAPEDAGVDAAAEQDAATPDAEVSPADSEVDAAVQQDAEPADASVSPDMNQSDATPDGGMVEEDSAVPDQGVDMAADQGADRPAVCGDNVCDITETVNNCLADCFEAFSVTAGDCRIEVNLVEEGVVELQGTGETADTCIAEFKVPGFDTPVRYIVNSEAERGRLEFEGVIFLDENGEPMLGTVWGRNVHTIVNLEEDGQKWLLGDLNGLSLAGVATKILLQKISEDEEGNQLWKAVNGNTIVEGGVYAFDPKGNVVAIIPPAATFHFEVNEEEERVEIQAVETGDAEPGLRIVGGSACSDAEQDGCETIPTKGNAPISLLLLAAARVGMRRRKR
ncbi:hypothetical protein KA119_01075 [Candidatus Gracilibacteria bacterium]|nr:hypothetical protein [Candidatus Gracilibacteria bacterium]